MKKTKTFVYTPRTQEQLKKRLDKTSGFDKYIKDGTPLLTFKEGKHRIRILPPTWDNAEHYGYDIYLNYGIGPDKQSYLSLSKMKKGRDPIAEERTRAQNDGREDDAKALNARKRILVWAVDRKREAEGPQLFAMPVSVDQEIATRAVDDINGGVLSVDNPYDGYDVIFNKTGEGLKTKYPGVDIARQSSQLSDDDETMQKWLEFVQANPIPDCLKFYSYEHIKAVFNNEAVAAKPESSPVADEAEEDEGFDDNNLAGKDRLNVVERDIEDETGNEEDDESPFLETPPVKPEPKLDAAAAGGRLRMRIRRE